MVDSELYTNNSVFAPDVGDFSFDEPEPDEDQIQDEADQEIVDGLAGGNLMIPEEGMQRLANNRNARVQIQLSQGLDREQKQDAIRQSYAADTEIRRAAMPPPPEQVAASWDTKLQKLYAQMSPEDRQRFQGKIVEGSGGEPQLMRGAKDDPQQVSEKGGQGGGAFSNNPATVTDVVSESQSFTKDRPANIVTQKDYDALPGGSWYVNRHGTKGQKPFTPQQKMQQQFEQQYPNESWEDWKDHVWVQNPKTGLMEIDTTADKIKNPPPEKPPKPTEAETTTTNIAVEKYIREETDKEVAGMVTIYGTTEVPGEHFWSQDRSPSEAEQAAYAVTIRPQIEKKYRDKVESWKVESPMKPHAPGQPQGGQPQAVRPKSGSGKFEWDGTNWVPVGGT